MPLGKIMSLRRKLVVKSNPVTEIPIRIFFKCEDVIFLIILNQMKIMSSGS